MNSIYIHAYMYAHTWVWKTVECSTSFTVFINMIIEIECKIHPREMNSMKPQAKVDQSFY